jgi:putative sigma-54 modulation protein
MKVTYTGRHLGLSPEQSENLTGEFEKIGKLLDNGRGECQAHVTFAHDSHLNNVEITVPYHHHELVGHGSHADLFSAFHVALVKLEGQAIKVRGKWRDVKRAEGRIAIEEDEASPASGKDHGSKTGPV